MIKAILFDCFGVLYPDTYWTMAREFLGDKLDAHLPELHDLIKQVDLGYVGKDELWHRFADISGSNLKDILARLADFGGLDKNLLDYVEDLKTTYKTGMISNVGQGFIDKMFTTTPIEHYFDTVVLSSDVGLTKPDPRIYEIAAARLGCDPSDCIFIDDLEKNVTGARQVGMQGILYTHFADFKLQLETLL